MVLQTTKIVLTSLNVCNLICDPYASLWPLPTGNISIQKVLATFSKSNITFINFSGNYLWIFGSC